MCNFIYEESCHRPCFSKLKLQISVRVQHFCLICAGQDKVGFGAGIFVAVIFIPLGKQHFQRLVFFGNVRVFDKEIAEIQLAIIAPVPQMQVEYFFRKTVFRIAFVKGNSVAAFGHADISGGFLR